MGGLIGAFHAIGIVTSPSHCARRGIACRRHRFEALVAIQWCNPLNGCVPNLSAANARRLSGSHLAIMVLLFVFDAGTVLQAASKPRRSTSLLPAADGETLFQVSGPSGIVIS